MFSDLTPPAWLESKGALVNHLITRRDLPPFVKAAAAGLSFLPEADFTRLRDTFLEIVGALGETARGRAILLDMRLDDWVLHAASGDQRE